MKSNHFKYLTSIFLITFISVNLKAQEEFFGNHSGLSAMYSHSSLEGTNSVGLSLSLKSGLIIGISTQKLGNEGSTQFFGGFMKRHLDLESYWRPSFILSYVSNSYASIIGSNIGFSYIMNAQNINPTSISGIINLSNVSYKAEIGTIPITPSRSELIPVIGIVLNQALGANAPLSPYIGIGLAYNLNYTNTSFLISFGFNINFLKKEKS